MDYIPSTEGAFNLVLIVPVLVTVFGVIAVYVFGFKKPLSPKFRKVSEHSFSGGNGNNKKPKRTSEEATSTQQQPKYSSATAKTKNEVQVASAVVVDNANNKSRKTQVAALKSQAKKTLVAKAATNTKEKTTNARNVEKPLDDGGEWQTVITKKPKKNVSTNDLLIQAVAEAAAGAALHKSGVGGKTVILKNNNDKQAKEQANKTKKAATDEQQKRFQEVNVVCDNKSFEEQLETKPKVVPQPALGSSAVHVELNPSEDALMKPSVEISDGGENLVFDDLGDAAWTEAIVPKKSKKRALRE